MVTTGELRAIIEELQLVDIGDAASYLGEEAMVGEADAIHRVPTHIAAVAVGEVDAIPHVPPKTEFSASISVEEVNRIGALSMSAQ